MFEQYRMCGVRDIAPGLGRTSATLHNMKADGRFPKPAHSEPGHRGACRWYVATVDVWFSEFHKLLNQKTKSSFDDCAREATRRAVEFDEQFRLNIRSTPGRESEHERNTAEMVAA